MLWFNFILDLTFIFLCCKLIIIHYHTLSYIATHFHTLSYITIQHQRYHILSCITIYYHTLPYIITHYHTLSYIIINYHTLPYITIHYHKHYHTQKQRKIKFKPRIKLKHNRYTVKSRKQAPPYISPSEYKTPKFETQEKPPFYKPLRRC